MTATRTPEQRLAALRNHATLYEMEIRRGTEAYLVCYSDKKSRSAFFKCVSKPGRAERLVALTGSESIAFAKKATDGGTMGGWTLKFTGRSEREAIAAGELSSLPQA